MDSFYASNNILSNPFNRNNSYTSQYNPYHQTNHHTYKGHLLVPDGRITAPQNLVQGPHNSSLRQSKIPTYLPPPQVPKNYSHIQSGHQFYQPVAQAPNHYTQVQNNPYLTNYQPQLGEPLSYLQAPSNYYSQTQPSSYSQGTNSYSQAQPGKYPQAIAAQVAPRNYSLGPASYPQEQVSCPQAQVSCPQAQSYPQSSENTAFASHTSGQSRILPAPTPIRPGSKRNTLKRQLEETVAPSDLLEDRPPAKKQKSNLVKSPKNTSLVGSNIHMDKRHPSSFQQLEKVIFHAQYAVDYWLTTWHSWAKAHMRRYYPFTRSS